MIRKLIIASLAFALTIADSYATIAMPDTYLADITSPISETYIDNAVVPSWRDNWFVNVSGGASAFIGSPIGCEDLFGRTEPTLQLSVGKWHTPTIGNRLVFQGFKWKSGELQEQQYRHYHADLLWNITPMLNRFDIIPLIGVGIIDNRTSFRRPFALNYGVQGRYKLTDYLHITAELGNATTFRDSDGIGEYWRMGDNHLSLTAGIAWTFGRNIGWKKVIDSKPYIQQNEQLSAYAYALRQRNSELERANNNSYRIIAELRKILEIEGLLDKYADSFDDNNEQSFGYPLNDYSGLNSLRKRMREDAKIPNKRHNSRKDNAIDSIPMDNSDCIGAPIFFFFELGTSDLVDNSQLINLNEIARIALKYNLKIDIVGAADSFTGTEDINDNLGTSRSEYIANYLIQNGIDSENITLRSVGGIATYTPNSANRNAIVRLTL
jgi:outer membrane protein OmpA-like peptidoglycan-associated protein